MPHITIKRFDRADETIRHTEQMGRTEILQLEDITLARLTLEPGWRWSSHEKPLVGTESCQVPHTVFVLSGRLQVVLDDGEEAELRAGDAAYIPPGHDGWVLGTEPCVLVAAVAPGAAAEREQGRQAAPEQVPIPH